MSKRPDVRLAVMAAFLAASAASDVAFAIVEAEPNNTIATAQRLVIGGGGRVEVNGVIGVISLSSPAVKDVDFYSFEARKGDVVTIDIDYGWKAEGSATRSVDTIIAIFGPSPFPWDTIDDSQFPTDQGSLSHQDSFLPNVYLPVDGIYTVGVSSWPRMFRSNGTLDSVDVSGPNANGSYTLVISGVTPLVQQINIEIKPGSEDVAPINPRSKGNIPVALLSSEQFNALEVDRQSITFGATGDETKALRCGKGGEDVNGDGRPDLVCHFETQEAGFDSSSEAGIVKGTVAGRPFEGRGQLKVIPVKRR